MDGVVEDCVNAVGVDLNTASPALLRRVAGVTAAVAKNIVAYREENGPFPDRKTLKKVPKLGRRPLNSAPVSCGCPKERNGWTAQRYTQNRIRLPESCWISGDIRWKKQRCCPSGSGSKGSSRWQNSVA